ncbi:unnamed protein product [Gadus morhua 'NCC']
MSPGPGSKGSGRAAGVEVWSPGAVPHVYAPRLRRPLRVMRDPRGSVQSVLIMQNDAGEFVDMYVPRKCSASNRIIGAKDHASIQLNIAEVDKVTGRFNGQFKTYALCGPIRRMGEADDSLLRLAKTDNIVAKNF